MTPRAPEFIGPDADELTEIEQPELSRAESPRAVWEREAVRELFTQAKVPELTGDPNADSQALDGLVRVTSGLFSHRSTRSSRKRYEGLPQVTTPEGMEEVLTQIIALTEQHDEMLSTSVVANCTHLLSHAYDQLPPHVTEANPDLSVRFLSSMLALANEQEARNPALRRGQQREYIYKALEKQFLAELVLEDPNDPNGILTPEIHAVWQDPDFLEVMANVATENIKNADHGTRIEAAPEGWTDFEKALMNKIFTSLGFDEKSRKKVTDGWGSVTDTKKIYKRRRFSRGSKELDTELRLRPEYVGEQFKAMLNLERMQPGSAHELFSKFGIRHFARYRREDLLRQLSGEFASDSHEVVITASDDWNTAFDDHKGTEKTMNFSSPVYFEASNMTELLREVVSASRRYGAIKVLNINGHGAPHLFQLGLPGEPNNGVVNIGHVEAAASMSRLVERQILADDCDVLISSCSVGEPGGVAEAIAHATGLRVIAPDDLSSGMYYDHEEGDYNARYRNPSGKNANGDAVVYDAKRGDSSPRV